MEVALEIKMFISSFSDTNSHYKALKIHEGKLVSCFVCLYWCGKLKQVKDFCIFFSFIEFYV